MNFGKFKYKEQKRLNESRSKQKKIQIKEVKFRSSTDNNDYKFKIRNLKKFISIGNKVKVSLRFRGREIAHQDFGMKMLERIKYDLINLVNVESKPKLEGRQITMLLSPIKK